MTFRLCGGLCGAQRAAGFVTGVGQAGNGVKVSGMSNGKCGRVFERAIRGPAGRLFA